MMISANQVSYSQYVETFPLSQEDIIEHLMHQYHPDLTVKQRLFTKQNLTLILEATFKLSRIMSFSKMTVRDLQKETGISMGSLYNCIGSKEDLESMIIEGVSFITDFTQERGLELKLDDKSYLVLSTKAYIYLGRMFKPWYFFVSMESRSMTPDNLEKVKKVRTTFITELSAFLNGNMVAASHISTIIQDYIIRDWKYEAVDIDDFADHCVRLAILLNDNSKILGDLPISA